MKTFKNSKLKMSVGREIRSNFLIHLSITSVVEFSRARKRSKFKANDNFHSNSSTHDYSSGTKKLFHSSPLQQQLSKMRNFPFCHQTKFFFTVDNFFLALHTLQYWSSIKVQYHCLNEILGCAILFPSTPSSIQLQFYYIDEHRELYKQKMG